MSGSTFFDWVRMCAGNDEFVSNYNLLRGTRLTFKMPPRTPFEKLIDEATGHTPQPKNNPVEIAGFMAFCADQYARIDLPTDDPETTTKAPS